VTVLTILQNGDLGRMFSLCKLCLYLYQMVYFFHLLFDSDKNILLKNERNKRILIK